MTRFLTATAMTMLAVPGLATASEVAPEMATASISGTSMTVDQDGYRVVGTLAC
ncbi:hypothetical protein [Rhizobium sullae]|uniref:hypothetical protein n=1 Tax=Rhizobium sullae TaxID=50338 RepID=UPI0015C681FA|nr:hypothetical protein [Rhizobium sullae]